jgi:H+/Cl- antiporter ClcA
MPSPARARSVPAMPRPPNPPAASDDAGPAQPQPRALLALLGLAAIVGIIVSLASWGFLELIHQIQTFVFTDLPKDLGFDSGPPLWYYLIVLGLAGLPIALAIVRLPGRGGHVPAEGLKVDGGPAQPIDVPGVLLAAFATIGLGLVLGPEAPLIALGAGLGLLTIRAVKRDTPDQAQSVIAASGSFAAVAMIFGSPLIAAVLLLEALGLDRRRLPLMLIPGLLASGIGSLISIGMGSLTGLSTSAYSLGALTLPTLPDPTFVDFLWTIPLAIVVAAITYAAKRIGLRAHPLVMTRPFLLLPVAGIVVAGLAIAFHGITGRSVDEVLFSGQSALPGLATNAATWSVSALIFVLVFKGIAWGVSLGSFRGGPTFPAIFIGAAAGVLASHLPGFNLTGAVGVGMAAGVTSMLKLPLTAVVLATVLVGKSGPGAGPLIIVGTVFAYIATVGISRALDPPLAQAPEVVAEAPVAAAGAGAPAT